MAEYNQFAETHGFNTYDPLAPGPDQSGAAINNQIESLDLKTAPLYDAAGEQQIAFTADDDSEIVYQFANLTDERYFSFEKASRVKLVDDGANLVSDNAKALGDLFDDLAIDVIGFEGEKPNNWKELLDLDREKAPAVSPLLTVAAFAQTKRVWGAEPAITTECYFNNKIATQKHFLRNKTISDLSDYRKFQKMPMGARNRRLAQSETVIPANGRGKAELYDKMKSAEPEGYANSIVPAWHKIAVIDFLFSSGLTAKK